MKYFKYVLTAALPIFVVSCLESEHNQNLDEEEDIEISEAKDADQYDNSRTPDAVRENFKKKYPGENDPDWQLDDKGNWEASFKQDGIHYRADYNADGSWIETESSIEKSDLPKAIKDILKSDYDDMEITEIERVDHNSKGIFYDVEFKQKGKNLDIEFNEKGEILNQ